MRIRQLALRGFKRFTELTISGLSPRTRLVILAGPNGCGKSSLFDAFAIWQQARSNLGWNDDHTYYRKAAAEALRLETLERVRIDWFDPEPRSPEEIQRAFYFRTAYRNDPEFVINTLERVGPVEQERRFRRMIDGDQAVSKNYQRLTSQALEDVFAHENESTTIGQFRERVIGEIRDSTMRLFPDLVLNTLGNPLDRGTFRFDKGGTRSFDYKNLSGGEKAAFDLILDLIVKRRGFPQAVYCIDEPDAHMNTRLQASLLGELLSLIPAEGQLWVATHSIGMMRKARELSEQDPEAVIFLDFDGHGFDGTVKIEPSRPTRAFWESVLHVALDDLAFLVAPKEIVVCEGNPRGAVPSKNAEHDATCYEIIFADQFPDTRFMAGGNSVDITRDRLGLVAALPKVAKAIEVRRLIDHDDHAAPDIEQFSRDGITVLGRRHLESYLYDDEVLTALCTSVGKPEEVTALLAEKNEAVEASMARGNPANDIKSAAGDIYVKAKQRLGLVGVGNNQQAFARATLAPLIKPGTAIYGELQASVFPGKAKR